MARGVISAATVVAVLLLGPAMAQPASSEVLFAVDSGLDQLFRLSSVDGSQTQET